MFIAAAAVIRRCSAASNFHCLDTNAWVLSNTSGYSLLLILQEETPKEEDDEEKIEEVKDEEETKEKKKKKVAPCLTSRQS